MKSLLLVGSLAVAALAACPTQVFAQDVEHPVPSVSVCLPGSGLCAGPLVRYLVASLQLSQEQAVAVQRALRPRPLQVRTPEQVALRLQEVLTLDQYDQLLQLHTDAHTYAKLQYLAVR